MRNRLLVWDGLGERYCKSCACKIEEVTSSMHADIEMLVVSMKILLMADSTMQSALLETFQWLSIGVKTLTIYFRVPRAFLKKENNEN